MPMNKKLALSAALLALLLAACAQAPRDTSGAQPAFYRNLESPGALLDISDAVRVISSYRQANGLSPVIADQELLAVAQNHARAQARAGRLGHNIGGSLSSRLDRVARKRTLAVENVGVGYRSFAQAFSGWRNSRGHNKNLLNPDVTRLGIAKAVNSSTKYKVFWTLIMTSDPVE